MFFLSEDGLKHFHNFGRFQLYYYNGDVQHGLTIITVDTRGDSEKIVTNTDSETEDLEDCSTDYLGMVIQTRY